MTATNVDLTRVWWGLLDAECDSRYYDAVRRRLSRWDDWTRIFVFVLSSSAGITTAGKLLPLQVAGGLMLAAVALTIALYVSKWGNRASVAQVVAGQYASLADSWKTLWQEMMSLDRATVEARIATLENFRTTLGAYSDQCGPIDEKLNERVTKHAYDAVSQAFASAT